MRLRGGKLPVGISSEASYNWIEVMFRAYGPKKELMEKQWRLPDLEVMPPLRIGGNSVGFLPAGAFGSM